MLLGTAALAATRAVAEPVDFDVAAQSADGALMDFARQAKVEVIYSFDELHKAESSGVVGKNEPEDALNRLLTGTGFTARRNTRGRYVVVRILPPVGSIRGRLVKPDGRAAAGIRVMIPAVRMALETTPIVTGVEKKTGTPITFSVDEHPRPETTIEQLAKLKPAFAKAGTVTAGNASGLNDGAAVVLIASESAIKEFGLTPKARYVAGASAGVEPSYMGLGPIPASKKAFGRAGLTAQKIDLAELNEAFAAQALPCIEQLGLDPERVNVNGGAIAWGHPLGASGAKLCATLLNELERTGGRYGLLTMCEGGGMANATIIERLG